MNGALLVGGTASDAGKSTVVAAICRWLRRQGVSVAPFKAQNMSLNSTVTPGGAEIGRAQALQAAACGIEPEAAMNPVLIKPSGQHRSQVLVMGTPYADATARSYQELKHELRAPVLAALDDLRSRFDVVVCEGAGSPAEINLRAGDLANMGLARAADMPVVLVGDIDRGGVFASLYGTLALLDPDDQALIAGFLINKFRGDESILAPGLSQLRELTGRPTFGVLPWLEGPFIDAEDSLALRVPPAGSGTLDVAVIRLRWMSNFTDVDALAAEPGVSVRYTRSAADVERADLVVLPGTKATVEDLRALRAEGLDRALQARRGPILGICGGYQMLGGRIEDDVESGSGVVDGLGLLPVETVFAPAKLLRRVRGEVLGLPASGYEIRHGRMSVDDPLLRRGDVLGTAWHGLLEGDAVRRALLSWVAERCGREWTPGTVAFADVREAQLERLADWFGAHVDTRAIVDIIEGAPCSVS
jgi:adenosylcobyric acid synthase